MKPRRESAEKAGILGSEGHSQKTGVSRDRGSGLHEICGSATFTKNGQLRRLTKKRKHPVESPQGSHWRIR